MAAFDGRGEGVQQIYNSTPTLSPQPLLGRGCGGQEPRVSGLGLGAPMCCQCAGGEAALLRPGRAAHTVAFKSRQQVRVLRDRQWQKFLRRVKVKGLLNCVGDAMLVIEGHDDFLLWLTNFEIKKGPANAKDDEDNEPRI